MAFATTIEYTSSCADTITKHAVVIMTIANCHGDTPLTSLVRKVRTICGMFMQVANIHPSQPITSYNI